MSVNIIIDAGFMCFSAYSTFSDYGKIKDPLKSTRSQASFLQELSNKLFYTLNQLPKGGQVVFCLDSRSWRKDFDKGYKSSREDTEGNKGIMDNESKKIFYKLVDEFGSLINKVGIHLSKSQGAEGDDLIFKWVEFFREKGENCVIVTGDHDMMQLVKGPEEPWTVVWSNKKNNSKIFSISGWKDSLNKPSQSSIFEFNISKDQDVISKMIRDTGTLIETVNPSKYLLHKILIGDDGDDVPSCWTVEKTNTRVTDGRAKKIIDLVTDQNSDHSLTHDEWLEVILRSADPKQIIENDFTDYEKRIDELSGTILRVMKDLDDSELRKKVSSNIIRNAKLMWLRKEMIPFNIDSMINESIERSIMNTPEADRSKWNQKFLLKGSSFEGFGSSAPKGFDPFSLIELPDETL